MMTLKMILVGAAVVALSWTITASQQDALPDGPGKEAMERVCSACHELDIAAGTRHTRAEWRVLVESMVSRGARATDEEIAAINEYLGTYVAVVNVNKAASAEIEAVLAIPAKVAEEIVRYRAEKGEFKDLESLKNVPGVDAESAGGAEETVSRSDNPRRGDRDENPSNHLLAAVLVPGLGAQTDWSAYGHDPGGQRYSPLTQINTQNVSKLKLAWQFGVDPAAADINPATQVLPATEAVPIVVGGVLYTPIAPSSILALESNTGREVWRHELGRARAPTRGVTYWPGDRTAAPRILAGTSDGRLIALDAKTGKLVPGFGKEGAIDLRVGVTEKFPDAPYRMSSPGVIYRNLIITGAAGKEGEPTGPAMDVRAWDLQSGKLVWTFHTIPHPGEAGYDTWPKDYWVTAGTPAHWGLQPWTSREA